MPNSVSVLRLMVKSIPVLAKTGVRSKLSLPVLLAGTVQHHFLGPTASEGDHQGDLLGQEHIDGQLLAIALVRQGNVVSCDKECKNRLSHLHRTLGPGTGTRQRPGSRHPAGACRRRRAGSGQGVSKLCPCSPPCPGTTLHSPKTLPMCPNWTQKLNLLPPDSCQLQRCKLVNVSFVYLETNLLELDQ